MDNDNTVKGEISDKTKKGSKVLKVLGIIGAVFFFITYIPFLILPFYAHLGTTDGILSSRVVYGWEAVTTIFMWFCIIPVFPVCILYQIAFGIGYIRRKGKAVNIAAIATVAAVIIATAVTCIIYIFKEKARTEELTPQVRAYLTEHYGEELANEAKLQLHEYDAGTFWATTKVLPDDLWFELDLAPDGYYDDLDRVFLTVNPKYEEGFRKYLDEQYDLPDDMNTQPHIASIDFTGYKNGDDFTSLFPKTGYEVAGVTVKVTHDEVVQDKLMELAMQAVNDICPRFEGHKLGHFMVYVRDTDFDETAASIQIDFPCADTMNFTVVQIEPRIYDDMPDTIWEDGFFAEEMKDVGYTDQD